MRGGHWSETQLLFAILAVAFLLRAVCALGVQWRLDHGAREVCLIPGDADGYWGLAGNIVAGQEFSYYNPPRRVMRMPGFPLLLAMPRFIFGDNLLAARIWLAVIGTAACGFTFLLGKELANPTAGLWAAAVTALSPVLSLFSVLILSETAFAAALTLSLYAAVKLHHRLSGPATRTEIWLAITTGLLFAVATYMRPTWLLLGPVTAALLLLPRKDIVRRLRAGALLCLGLYGALLPWGIRNACVTGHFTLTTFWVGPSLYDGLNPEATGDSNMTFFERDNLLRQMSEFEMDREYRRRAWEFAASHPRRTLELMAIKLKRYASPWPNAEQFRAPWQRAIVAISFSAILFPALSATWIHRRNTELLLVAWGPLLYFAAIHMLFVGSIRYRLPAEYPFAVLAGIGLEVWMKRFRHSSFGNDR